MRLRVLVIMLAALAAAAAGQAVFDGNGPYSSEPVVPQNTLKSGLIAWWDFDEASGTRFDTFGRWDFDTFAGANPTAVVGKDGNAARWTSTGQITSSSSSFLPNTIEGGMSFSAWVYLDSDTGTWQHIIGDTGGSNSLMRIRAQPGQVIVGLAGDFGEQTYTAVQSGWGNGKWSHVAYSWVSYPTAKAWVWLDGEKFVSTGSFYINTNALSFLVGRTDNPTGERLSGRIDAAGFWEKPFSDEEAAALWYVGAGWFYATRLHLFEDSAPRFAWSFTPNLSEVSL